MVNDRFLPREEIKPNKRIKIDPRILLDLRTKINDLERKLSESRNNVHKLQRELKSSLKGLESPERIISRLKQREKVLLLEIEKKEKLIISQKAYIEELEDQKKLALLTEELEKVDEDLETLKAENEKLRKYLASKSEAKIIDSTFRVIPKSEILKKIREILGNAVHYVTIAVPDINNLQDLHLYEVPSSVKMNIMCNIDPSLEEDAKLLEELESLDNITIRLYEDRDRLLIDRDGEELLFSIVGSREDNNLVIYTKDPKHLAKKSKFDGDDRFPFPYIFNHPRPPDDFASAAQVITPLKKEDAQENVYCQYCGMELTKGDGFTHSCKKKPA